MIRWPESANRFREMIQQNSFEVPEYNQRSFRGPEGYQVGLLGEIVAMDWLDALEVPYEAVFATDYDLLVDGHKWEIKTKERTVEPKPYYDCTVPAYNHEHQRPDVFCFVSLLSTGKSPRIDRFTGAYILGTVRMEDLESRARYLTPDSPPDSNGWVPTIACYNLRIDELDSPRIP